MKTWDDVKLLYYKIAHKYVDIYPQYDLYDFVSEAWIRTRKKLDHKKLPHLINFAIREFLKTQLKRYRKDFVYNEVTETLVGIDYCFKDVDGLDSVETYDIIENAMKKLTLEERIILFLRFFCDWTEIAIGKALDKMGVVFQGVTYEIPTNVIKYRIKCILEKIRKEVAL